jgi:hypothetical protein
MAITRRTVGRGHLVFKIAELLVKERRLPPFAGLLFCSVAVCDPSIAPKARASD